MKQVSLLTLVVIGGLLLVPLSLRLFKKEKSRLVYLWSLASLYAGSVLYFTLFCRNVKEMVRFRLQPFITYKIAFSCLTGKGEFSKTDCYSVLRSSKNIFQVTKNSPIEDCLLNITLFLPFGFFAGYLFKKTPLWKILLYALTFSICIELIQAIFHIGSCETDDVLNNTLGTFLGWLLFRLSARRK